MRGDLAEAGLAGIADNRLEVRLLRNGIGTDPSGLVHTPPLGPRGGPGGRSPAIEGVLGA